MIVVDRVSQCASASMFCDELSEPGHLDNKGRIAMETIRRDSGESRERTGQRTENRRQRAEDRGQRAEDTWQRTEDRG